MATTVAACGWTQSERVSRRTSTELEHRSGDRIAYQDGLCEGSNMTFVGRRLWRLSSSEYERTIMDLTGLPTQPAPPDVVVNGYRNQAATAVVSGPQADFYAQIAEQIAQDVAEKLVTDAACDISVDACAEELVVKFAARAFRAPISPSQRQRLLALYQSGKTPSPENALKVAVEGILQSPLFLYRKELGVKQEGRYELSSYELAEQLAYLLTGRSPDDKLWEAAVTGELPSSELLKHAQRILAEKGKRDIAQRFALGWLGLSEGAFQRDDGKFPTFREAAPYMTKEVQAFVDHVMFEGDARIETLLTASFSFLNEPLSKIYGIDGIVGSDLQLTNLPVKRSGLLTIPGVLAAHSGFDTTRPPSRGKFIRERMLCATVPPPPPGVEDIAPRLEPDMTTRERFTLIASNPACGGCHQQNDPIGFAFEGFDPAGGIRTHENGKVVDTSGKIIFPGSGEHAFADAVQLGPLLAKDASVKACIANHFAQFAYGGSVKEDSCVASQITVQMIRLDGNLSTVLKNLIVSDGFRYRQEEE